MQSICGTGAVCTYSYHEWWTPHLRSIYPASQNPNKLINLYGYFRSENTEEFKHIKVGEKICDRKTVFTNLNLNDAEELNVNNY